jgi:hypothetical protein
MLGDTEKNEMGCEGDSKGHWQNGKGLVAHHSTTLPNI